MSEQSDNSWKDVLLARLQDAMWGYNGTNGVVGSTKDHGRRIEHLEQWKRDIDLLKEFVRWLALGLVALGGLLLSDPAVRLIIALQGVVK